MLDFPELEGCLCISVSVCSVHARRPGLRCQAWPHTLLPAHVLLRPVVVRRANRLSAMNVVRTGEVGCAAAGWTFTLAVDAGGSAPEA